MMKHNKESSVETMPVLIPGFETDEVYGKRCISGKMSVENLLQHRDVATSRPGLIEAYQRVLRIARKTEIARAVTAKKGNIQFPTPLVIAVRNEDAFNYFKDGVYKYDYQMHGPLWLIDGQSRSGGLEHAREEAEKLNEDGSHDDVINTINKKNLNVLIVFTNDVNVEMRLFVDINNNAKKVETNLAMEILQKRYRSGESDVAADLEIKGEKWKLIAGEIVDLMEKSPIWAKRIKRHGDETILSPNVGYASMQLYVNHVLDGNFFKGKKNARVLASQAIKAYWEGFALACPAIFDKPNNFTAQTAMGSDVFMRLFDKIVSWTQQTQGQTRGEQLLSEPETYVPAFQKLIRNSDGYNRAGQKVSGYKFWEKGAEGAAGMYTSGAGKTALTNLCCDWLESEEDQED